MAPRSDAPNANDKASKYRGGFIDSIRKVPTKAETRKATLPPIDFLLLYGIFVFPNSEPKIAAAASPIEDIHTPAIATSRLKKH